MTNHVHLLATPQAASGLSRLMQSLGRRYAQYVSRTYRRSGSVWEGRFKASLIHAEDHLLKCYRYIELNPVRADVVRDPGEYRWSSYRWQGLGEKNELIEDHRLYLGLDTKDDERRAAYRALFRAHLDEDALVEIRAATQRGLPLGSEGFREQVAAALGRRVAMGRRSRREVERTKVPLQGQLGLEL